MTSRLLNAFIALICSATFTFASTDPQPAASSSETCQRDGLHGRGKTDRLAMLSSKLGLTADQQTRIKAVFDQSQSQMKALQENSALSEDVKKWRITAIGEEMKTEIGSLLTPNQQTVLDQLKSNLLSAPKA